MASVGELSVQLTGDASGLDGAVSTASKRIGDMENRVKGAASTVDRLGKNFEKLGRAVQVVGTAAAAFRAFSSNAADAGSEISKVTDKVQDVAMAVGVFGGPYGRAAALGVTLIGEGVKFVDRQVNSLSESQKIAMKRAEEMHQANIKSRQAIEGVIAGLKEEAETFGMSAHQVQLYKLAKDGATNADIRRAEALIAEIDLMSKRKAEEEALAKATEERTERSRKAVEDANLEFAKAFDEREKQIEEFKKIERPSLDIKSFGSREAFQRTSEIVRDREKDNAEKLSRDQLVELKRTNTILDAIKRSFGVPTSSSDEDVIVNF